MNKEILNELELFMNQNDLNIVKSNFETENFHFFLFKEKNNSGLWKSTFKIISSKKKKVMLMFNINPNSLSNSIKNFLYLHISLNNSNILYCKTKVSNEIQIGDFSFFSFKESFYSSPNEYSSINIKINKSKQSFTIDVEGAFYKIYEAFLLALVFRKISKIEIIVNKKNTTISGQKINKKIYEYASQKNIIIKNSETRKKDLIFNQWIPHSNFKKKHFHQDILSKIDKYKKQLNNGFEAELFLFNYLDQKYNGVIHESVKSDDLGYDISYLNKNNKKILVEVKSINSMKKADFFISKKQKNLWDDKKIVIALVHLEKKSFIILKNNDKINLKYEPVKYSGSLSDLCKDI